MNSTDLNLQISRRIFLAGTAAAVGGAMLPTLSKGAEGRPEFKGAEPWAPHAKAAPVTEQRGAGFALDANGTRTCSGGWQWRFDGIEPGNTYVIEVEATHEGLTVPRDALQCLAIWGAPGAKQQEPEAVWDFLLPESVAAGRVRFARRLVAPEGARQLTVRSVLRWTASGKTLWQAPRVGIAGVALAARPAVRACVVTGQTCERQPKFKSIKDSIAFYSKLCEGACEQRRPQLIVLPETALQWCVPGNPLERAVAAPGPETDAFSAIARRHRVRIALGMFERDSDAVYNSLLLIGPGGDIDGRYHKVHLAAGGEDMSGILPGDGFPVFGTEIGRIGCNICMDSSATESSRMAGLNGADLLLLPIMGDHRADRWSRGSPIYNEDRWRAIMRTHAMDNQVCMVVARNNALGSCIVDRKGEVLAWNDGDQPFISAEVPFEDGYRTWDGGCFRDVNWLQRRPHLYAAFTDPANRGGAR